MWHDIDIEAAAAPRNLEGYRVVESQEFIATRSLVDSNEEHELLERLVENTKPAKPFDCSVDDYLLFTPFRYPPLKEGTRFGKVTERSAFYGAEKLEAACCEKAYRLFKFNRDTEAEIPPRSVSYTSFKFHAKARFSLDLTCAPFEAVYALIHAPNDYSHSQALGSEMREKSIDACLFDSVRCKDSKNIAIFNPQIFTKKHTQAKHWLCYVSDNSVSFSKDRTIIYSFNSHEHTDGTAT